LSLRSRQSTTDEVATNPLIKATASRSVNNEQYKQTKNDQISQIVHLNDLVHTNKLKLKILTLHKVMLLVHIINTRSTILRKE